MHGDVDDRLVVCVGGRRFLKGLQLLRKIYMENSNKIPHKPAPKNFRISSRIGDKGAIIFFRMGGGGGHEKAGGSQNFFMKNRGVTKKSRDYWVATNFNENLLNEIAPKMHIFRITRIGDYMFLQDSHH